MLKELIQSIKKVLVLADDSSFWKIGGLFQLDRIMLNVIETLTSEDEKVQTRFFIYWKKGTHKNDSCFFIHPVLKRTFIDMSDDAESFERWFHSNEKSVLVVRTNLVLGRGSLNNLHSPYILFLKESQLQHYRLANNDGLWDALSHNFEPAKDKGDSLSCAAGFYENVEEISDIKACERRLFKSLSKPTDGLAAKYLNRPLSIRISQLLVQTPITPNQWSLFLFGVTLTGAWILTLGNKAGFILGTFLYQMVSLLDGCDGELARVRFQESKQGEWIDTLSDLGGNILFLAALGLGLSRQDGIDIYKSRFFLWEGIVCAFAMASTLWGVSRFTQKREGSGHFNNFGRTIINELELTGWVQKVSLFLAKILKRDSYMLIFFIMTLFDLANWILHLMGIGILIHVIVLLRSLLPLHFQKCREKD